MSNFGSVAIATHNRAKAFRRVITEAERKDLPAVALAVAAMGILALILNVSVILVGIHHTLYDAHSWRQTQTALGAESLLRGDSFLRYETPLLGPPWSMPLEFPLYQGIVAGIIKIFGTPLEETGRAVSILFFYLCFFPLGLMLHRLGFRPIQIVIVLAILLVSPLYIFWSRVFMRESMVLFFSLMYAERMFQLSLGEQPWRYRQMFAATVFGAAAGMVKVTTFAPYYMLGVCVATWQAWKLYRAGAIDGRRIGVAALFTGILPVVFTGLWTNFADNVMSQNPLGALMTAKAQSSGWVIAIPERLQLRWYHLLEFGIHYQIGYTVAAVLIVGVYAGLHAGGEYSQHLQRWTLIAAACGILYTGTTILFFKLHAAHEYYPYATALFLVVGIGALIAPLIELPERKAWLGVVLMFIEMCACVSCYFRHYYPIQSRNYPGSADVAALIDRSTSRDGVILVTGQDWAPLISYQSHRRAIMDAYFGYAGHPMDAGPVQKSIENLGPRNIAAVVACGANRNSDRLRVLLQIADMKSSSELHGDECDVYERGAGQ